MSKYIDYGDDKIPIEEALEKMEEEIGERDEEISKYWEVLNKIKEEVEYWGYEEEYNDDKIFCKCMKKIHELLEEIEYE